MPAFQGTKVAFHPEMHMMHNPRAREMLYARGKASPMVHPMFDALKTRHAQDKHDYARMMKLRDLKKMAGECGYPTFDSLKLLGAENDANYLDVFMSDGTRPRMRSNSHTSKGSSKRNSNVDVENIKKTLLGSLRSAASDENIYESVEVIQYRKTVEAISRQNKVRSVPKTGHPLFDHLRVENVLKPRRQHSGEHHQHHHHHHRRSETHNSDGGSNSHSSSGSGDEFDYAKKPNCRFSRREVLMTSQTLKKHPKEARPQKHSREQVAEAGSESDDDWAIPRPKICGRNRRTGATGLMNTVGQDESDSSSKSTGLR
ncbi:hypothetical protein OTU49_017369 [Cherax quadricarinatus]|uniref:Uncharacterized protein n=1 Tax=Cherax quadricarinatus TaxID=27406 RepID=A0AAW0XTQ6_CHEQU|nr:uncharacterized protein LOC128689436 [Cherax quadricarinatus]